MTLSGYSGKSDAPVVLPADLNGVELSIGRRGPIEGHIEDRNMQAREPRAKAAVGEDSGQLAARNRCRGLWFPGVLLGQLALRSVHDGRALGDSVDHQVVVAVRDHR